jgi:phosphate transport system substrate-binding protein
MPTVRGERLALSRSTADKNDDSLVGGSAVKINRHGIAVLGVAAVGALVAACGTNNNTGSGSTSPSSSSNIQCASGTLNAAGSTAQQNAISQWSKDFQNACNGVTFNYAANGSGAGVQQFEQGTVDFAGSDFALSGSDIQKANARCKTGNAIDLPMAPGPIAVGYNVTGVTTSLNLSASVLAKIFTGKITNWNDPAIKADNSGANLPNLAIQTFHRSDSSGTTYNFTNYLSHDAAADWTLGANKNWPGPGGQGGKGSSVVAQDVKTTAGGIGYFEQSFATQNNITYANVGNASGQFVQLTTANVAGFLSKATPATTGSTGAGDLGLQFNYADTSPTDYPNVLVTYEIVCSKGNDPTKLGLIKGFLGYAASTTGQAQLTKNSYVPLPSNLQSQVASAVSALG